MGSQNSQQRYGAIGRKDELPLDPDKVRLITDKSHPAYDASVHDPVDEQLAHNILTVGQIEPIVVRMDEGDEYPYVVVGRSRLKAIRRANEILAERGEEKMLVRTTIQARAHGDMKGAALQSAIMVSENIHRREISAVQRAMYAETLSNNGVPDNKIVGILKLDSIESLRMLRKLLDLAEPVQKAVHDGQIAMTTAVKELGKLTLKEQEQALSKAIESGAPLKGRGARAAVRQAANGESPSANKPPKALSRKKIEAVVANLSGKDSETARVLAAALRFVLGQEPDETIKDLVTVPEKPGKKTNKVEAVAATEEPDDVEELDESDLDEVEEGEEEAA